MRKIMLALGLTAALPVAAFARDTNTILGFTGLGDGGNATISEGAHTTDGSGTWGLLTGSNPDAYGTVTFLLNTANPGFAQPCVFGYGVGTAFWPMSSQIGFLSTDHSSGSVTMYWRSAELAPDTEYSGKFVCPAKFKNPNNK